MNLWSIFGSAVAFSGSFIGTASVACSLQLAPRDWVDPPLAYYPADGRFEDASGTYHAQFFGDAVRDLGDGIVAQKMHRSSGCATHTEMLTVDCSTTVALTVTDRLASHPRLDRGDLGFSLHFSVTHGLLTSHYERLANFPEVGPASMAAILGEARQKNLLATFDVEEQLARMEPRNRFDPFIGCKIYYPDSAGAQI